ncbi:glycoside hydrolase family 2 TIM barrel-domain containing protein [Cohnella hashimotonis]|uniref:beta-galactosidase n=1 Tax=Cohnella hashimotonis TaxID=2826895 RepID=A0ABT6TQP0_9BACL|nr:glycoside hydrolase family 2 TIM barrel-domain containing protein [Cohnella hashimotonis]MDI4649034.1 glycoside hydrolase family 2 TIM barrel-domain containing protein [Cohnella hashimotonis]
MLTTIDLSGSWNVQLDAGKGGLRLPFDDTMQLPGTTSHAQKGPKNEAIETGHLTDEYKFEGWVWFSREVDVPEAAAGGSVFLYLERTRMTTVWIDGLEAGARDSLGTPHSYELTGLLAPGRHTITIRVDNTDYPTKGGHLTSPDTQTNWNGITGRIELRFAAATHLLSVQVYPRVTDRSFVVRADWVGRGARRLAVSAVGFNGHGHAAAERIYDLDGSYGGSDGSSDGYSDCDGGSDDGENAFSTSSASVRYALGDDARLWSDAEPHLYRVYVRLLDENGKALDAREFVSGLREFKADGDKFAINGVRTFLRGKHDGLIFPLTGFAPTSVDEWVRILGIAKSYGINHYRFHTCCPPEAAFEAADRLGIFMEPELPFWGTVTDVGDANHDQAQQDYLVREGFAMLDAYGNHPSFVMMSLGNELWGSKDRLDAILAAYKAHDDRHLYAQGCNNFQFAPVILPNDDFYCGVRFARDRLFRGSYAMCDAPLGHVQTDRPGTRKDYDAQIVPPASGERADTGGEGEGVGADARAGVNSNAGEGAIQIQYGTGTKTVQADAAGEALVPKIPVVSHEIGQYAMYPRYDEIAKYTGSLKARNLETFRERLEAKGLGHLADRYFEASGRLAVACYKEELEAAFRSRRLAGFQLLDLQDFSGQGTALVGILDAFMDSKGLVTPEEWRTYCSDAVLLARFEKYNYAAGERFDAHVELACFRQAPLGPISLRWAMTDRDHVLAAGTANTTARADEAYIDIADLSFELPDVGAMTKVVLHLEIDRTDIRKTYELWIYPRETAWDPAGIRVSDSLSDDTLRLLEKGERVLLLAKPDLAKRSVEGAYCADFWCYPMFRSISESMNKPLPVGTHGLLIEREHPALAAFPSETHSTYPWWSLVQHARSFILDDLPPALAPIVRTIDNFERNHKLGFLFECRALEGSLLVCALDADRAAGTPEGRQFLSSLANYVRSDAFRPQVELSVDELRKLL